MGKKKVKMTNYKFDIPHTVNTVLKGAQWFIDTDMKFSRKSDPNFGRALRSYFKSVTNTDCTNYIRKDGDTDIGQVFHYFIMNGDVSGRWVIFCNCKVTREELSNIELMKELQKDLDLELIYDAFGIARYAYGKDDDPAVIRVETLHNTVMEVKTMKRSDLNGILEK